MRVLVGCEFSGVVREAFARMGCDAWSVDYLPSEIPGKHIIGDVRDYLDLSWDLAIFHPPCNSLAVSGARWFNEKREEQKSALQFVRHLLSAPISRIALENPISIISTRIARPSQIIQPWQYGHPETKATCLWLKNLPLLVPTKIVSGRVGRVHFESPGPDRWKNRSRTLPGIADAFARQWGAYDSRSYSLMESREVPCSPGATVKAFERERGPIGAAPAPRLESRTI